MAWERTNLSRPQGAYEVGAAYCTCGRLHVTYRLTLLKLCEHLIAGPVVAPSARRCFSKPGKTSAVGPNAAPSGLKAP
jgi:hypothetical protein